MAGRDFVGSVAEVAEREADQDTKEIALGGVGIMPVFGGLGLVLLAHGVVALSFVFGSEIFFVFGAGAQGGRRIGGGSGLAGAEEEGGCQGQGEFLVGAHDVARGQGSC